MKTVDYTDEVGRRFRVVVPEDCPPELYGAGVHLGPPDLEELGLPLDIEIRLNNQLHNRGLLTINDVLRRPQDVMAAILGAARLDVQRIQSHYKNAGGGG